MVFPSTLQDFGYGFNDDGQLRKLNPETKLPGTEQFEFNVTSDAVYNQKHYEALGEVITEHVYSLLEGPNVSLERLIVPKSENENSPKSFIFASNDAFSKDKLMVLIHGSGVVRAGQWARSLIINNNLDSGTQIPYIKRAKQLDYGIVVLNTNDNHCVISGKSVPIEGSSDPLKHACSVWEDYIIPSKAKRIAVVAHSFGGVCTVQLVNKYFQDFLKRVFAIGFTDSVHESALALSNLQVHQYLNKVCRNWVSSTEPLDMPVKHSSRSIVQCFSAGHSRHEMTSWSCMDSLFKFIEKRLEDTENCERTS